MWVYLQWGARSSTKPEMLSTAPDKATSCSCLVSGSGWSRGLPLPPSPRRQIPAPFPSEDHRSARKWSGSANVHPGLLPRLSQLSWLRTQGWNSICPRPARQLVLPQRLQEILNKYSVQEAKCRGWDLMEILIPEGSAHHVGLSQWDAGFWRCLLMTLFMFIFQCCGSSQELWTKCLLTLGLYKHKLKGWSCSRTLSLFGKLTSELILFYLNQASKIYSECLFFRLGAYLSLSLFVLHLATFLSPFCTVAFLVQLHHLHFQVCAPMQSCLIVPWDSVTNWKKRKKKKTQRAFFASFPDFISSC